MNEDSLVIRGGARDVDVAAIVTAVTRLQMRVDADPPRARSLWARPSRQIRPSLNPGPGAWRASTLPR